VSPNGAGFVVRRTSAKEIVMKVKTQLKAGALVPNHNEALARDARDPKVQTGIKAGALGHNHNEALARDARGLTVRTGVKAGEVLQSGW
jgi:hypothetical protein